MTPVLLHDDKPLRVEGFANIFGTPAETECGTEVFRLGAFASSLKSGQDVIATWGHDAGFTWASTADESLELWETPTGLAFQATVESSLRGRGLVDFIAQGQAAASITFTPLDIVETASGREVVSATLSEICVFWHATYPTAVWLAGDAQLETLSPRAQDLRRRWTAEREAWSTVDHAVKRAPARATSARAQRARALAAVSDEEALLPPSNWSMEEWLDFGQRCAHGAKWCK